LPDGFPLTSVSAEGATDETSDRATMFYSAASSPREACAQTATGTDPAVSRSIAKAKVRLGLAVPDTSLEMVPCVAFTRLANAACRIPCALR